MSLLGEKGQNPIFGLVFSLGQLDRKLGKELIGLVSGFGWFADWLRNYRREFLYSRNNGETNDWHESDHSASMPLTATVRYDLPAITKFI